MSRPSAFSPPGSNAVSTGRGIPGGIARAAGAQCRIVGGGDAGVFRLVRRWLLPPHSSAPRVLPLPVLLLLLFLALLPLLLRCPPPPPSKPCACIIQYEFSYPLTPLYF